MDELLHGFRIDHEACGGCFACMRSCPTHAIRVRHGKAELLSELCIDCGTCLEACTCGAIAARTSSIDEIGKFAYKVVVASPVICSQFPADVRPEHIVEGLLSVGFDVVWDYGVEIGLAARAIADYVDRWRGPRPLISISCPVIVRLVQVSYPRMVEQLIPLQPPRELAGREIKRRCPAELGLAPEQVAAIYITPCQARTISIIQPAEGGKSHLDGAVGISEVYNAVLAGARAAAKEGKQASAPNIVRSASMLRWSTSQALARRLVKHRYMSVTGLANVIQVFDDVEKGKLRDIEFLECYGCWGGCTNGNLTVDNVYVSQAKLDGLMERYAEFDRDTEREVERRFPHEDYTLERQVAPRRMRGVPGDLKERVRQVRHAEEVLGQLPGLDCGLCGAPSCKVLARDVSRGEAARTDCVFLSEDRLTELKRLYLRTTSAK